MKIDSGFAIMKAKEIIMQNWIPIDESELVCEMSNKYKEETGLPMNIWIDETKTYVRGGHGKRIKFQLNTADDFDASECGSMDLNGNIHPKNLRIKGLKSKDIQKLRNFVLNNKYALEHVADQDLWLYKVWPSMIMGGEPASYEEISKLNLKVDELIEQKLKRTNGGK